MKRYSLRFEDSKTTGKERGRSILVFLLLLLLISTFPTKLGTKDDVVLSMVSQSGSESREREFWIGFQEALVRLEGNANLHPEDPKAVYEYGNLCLKGLHTGSNARTAFEKALALKPDFAEAYNGLGWAYLDTWGMSSALLMRAAKPDLEEAIRNFRLAIKFNPDYSDSYIGLGYAYGQMGLNAEALASIRRALEFDPHNAEAWDLLSRTKEALAQYEEAIGAQLQSLRFRSQETRETALTCHYHFPRGESDDYLKLIELGGLYEKISHYDEAIGSYKQAIQMEPLEPQGHHHLGLAYFLKGDMKSAFGQYTALRKICLDADPDKGCDGFARDLFDRIQK